MGIILLQYVALIVMIILMRSIRDIYGLWISGLADMVIGLFFIILAMLIGSLLITSESLGITACNIVLFFFFIIC